MKTKLPFIITFIFSLATLLSAQDNCNVFMMNGDTCRFEACKYLEEAPSYFQLTKEYHEIKDKALEICPEYAVVYKHKSTAYLKTGDFIGWKKLIDKAVELNPKENLDYRGWCRFQFFRDYKGAIKDIELLESISKYDIGTCQNGDYHLIVAKGLCYKMLGEKTKALQIIKTQIEKDTNAIGLYDYLHLGVLYLELDDYKNAMDAFDKQAKINNLADNHYYKAITYKKLGDQTAYSESLKKAKIEYKKSNHMFDIYTHHVDKVFLKEIENELNNSISTK